MSSMEKISLSDLTRQERLVIWLRRAGISNAALARALGTGQATICRWINHADSLPSWRHRQLVEFGIPAELLPPAMDIPGGPKPGGKQAATVACVE